MFPDIATAIQKQDGIHRTFVIGGAGLYTDSLALNGSMALVDRILLTRIVSPAFDDCDTFMPNFSESGWTKRKHSELSEWVGFEVAEGVQQENGVEYEFQMWTR